MELWVFILTIGFAVITVFVEVNYPIVGAATWKVTFSMTLFGYAIVRLVRQG